MIVASAAMPPTDKTVNTQAVASTAPVAPVATPTPTPTPTPEATPTPTKTLADKEPDSNYEKTDTPTPVPTPTPNVTPTPTQAVYQDIAWAQYILRSSPLIGTDFTNAGSAADNLDYDALAIDGQNIVDDTQKALDENDQYSISPKYQDAQNEWVSGLKDYNLAGKYIVSVANDGKTGKTNSENLNKATSYTSSGTGHIKRATALIQAVAGTA